MSAPAFEFADLFCGAGGSSTGVSEALERLGYRPRLTAVNHWNIAVATHEKNHPNARHLCASLDALNPRDLFGQDELRLLWASPECTHHSIARGGKPINDQSRATAFCVTRWAEALRPEIILVENVQEFAEWGPLGANGKPLKSRKGEIFRAWLNTIAAVGYKVDVRVLCAADYGDPTTRRRLFVQAVRGRRSICWPEPTHIKNPSADLFASGLKAWRPAADVIDWNLRGTSIYERKRPLSDKTMRRIMVGLEKFGLRPFVGAIDHLSGNSPAVRSVDDPLSTITTKQRHYVANPYLVKLRGTGTAASLQRPTPSVTAGGTHLGLCEPFLVEVAHGNGADGNGDGRRAQSIRAPLKTVCGNRGSVALCEPFILPNEGFFRGNVARPITMPLNTVTAGRGAGALIQPCLLPQQSCGVLRPVSEPAPTVATSGAIGLVEPYLVKYYGTGGATSVRDPLDTVTTKERFGLVRPMIELHGEKYLLEIYFRMLQPHELALAQGFPPNYQFVGNKTETIRQIGNAVPRHLSRALALAAVGQTGNIARFLEDAA